MSSSAICLKCSAKVVPLASGDCPTCGAGLVAPEPGYAPEPEREITYSRMSRTREGKEKAWIRCLGGAIFCALGVAYWWSTYNAAVANGRGWYVIPVSAVVIGGFWMITGLIGLFTDGEMD